MSRWALVDQRNRKVLNVIDWEGASWTPPDGTQLVESDTANIGDTWDGSTFIPGVPPSIANQPVAVVTDPPPGKYRVTQLYVDPLTNKLVVEYDNTPVS